MTALDLVRRIRANPKGSDFQDVRHVEEFVQQKTALIWSELRDMLQLPSTDNDELQVKQELQRLLNHWDSKS